MSWLHRRPATRFAHRRQGRFAGGVASPLHPRVEMTPLKPASRTAKLRGMGSERPRRVHLTGDLAGDYVVVEERADGSVVVVPDTSGRPAPRRRRANQTSEPLAVRRSARAAGADPAGRPHDPRGLGSRARRRRDRQRLHPGRGRRPDRLPCDHQPALHLRHEHRPEGDRRPGAPAVRRPQRRAVRPPPLAEAPRHLARRRERHQRPGPRCALAPASTPDRRRTRLNYGAV